MFFGWILFHLAHPEVLHVFSGFNKTWFQILAESERIERPPQTMMCSVSNFGVVCHWDSGSSKKIFRFFHAVGAGRYCHFPDQDTEFNTYFWKLSSCLQRGGAQVEVAGGSVVVWAATAAASAGAEIFSQLF